MRSNRGIDRTRHDELSGEQNKSEGPSDAPCAPSQLFARHPRLAPGHPRQRVPWRCLVNFKCLPAVLVRAARSMMERRRVRLFHNDNLGKDS